VFRGGELSCRKGRPGARGVERHTDPGQDVSSLFGELLRGEILQAEFPFWQLPTVILKGHLGHGEGTGGLYVCGFLFEPRDAQRTPRFFRCLKKRENRPAGRKNKSVSIHAINAGITAIPSPARAHAVVEEADREFAAAQSVARQELRSRFRERHQRKRRRLDPTARSRRPSPAAVGIPKRIGSGAGTKASEEAAPPTAVARK